MSMHHALSRVAALLLCLAPLGAAAEPLNYDYAGFTFGAQDQIGLPGERYESDSTYGFNGSYRFLDNFFLQGAFQKGGYDLKGGDFNLAQWGVGPGFRVPLDTTPDGDIDFFGVLSFQSIWTEVKGRGTTFYDKTQDGAGLRLGLRAPITSRLSFTASVFENSYGSNFMQRKGGVDGLFFEVEGDYRIVEWLSLTASYMTGELDYKDIEGLSQKSEVEVDRDQFIVGLRINYDYFLL